MAEASVGEAKSSLGNVDSEEQNVREILKNYLNLMAECAGSDQALADFKANMHKELNEKVGMKIPEDVAIHLDTTKNRWATVYSFTKDGDVAITEGAFGAFAIQKLPLDEKDSSVIVKPFSEITVAVYELLQRAGIVGVLELPFFDVRTDPNIEFKFSDEPDIVIGPS